MKRFQPCCPLVASLFLVLTVEGAPMRVVTPANNAPSGVRVRDQSSLSGEILVVVPNGLHLEYDGDSPDLKWHRVRLPHAQYGYMSADYTNVSTIETNAVQFDARFIDVGSGSATLITANNVAVFVDAGGDAGMLRRYLSGHAVPETVALLIVTSRETEHFKAYENLLGIARPRLYEIWAPKPCNSGRNDELARYCQRAEACNIHVHENASSLCPLSLPAAARPGTQACRLCVDHPLFLPEMNVSVWYDDCNSQAVEIELAGNRVFFTGDIEGLDSGNDYKAASLHGEMEIVRRGNCASPTSDRPPLQVDVLTVPRHGGPTASSRDFIRAMNPKFAILSPAATCVATCPNLAARYEGFTLLRTDQGASQGSGTILCQFRDKNGRSVQCARESIR